MNLTKDISRSIPKRYLELLPNFQEEKTKNFTMLALTLVALSFFGFFAINPTLSTIAQLKKELADNIFVDEKLQEKINNLGILSQKYGLLGNDINIVVSAIPQNPNATLLIGQIQSLAGISNITVNKIQSFEVELTKKVEGQDNYSSFAFSIEGEGASYQDIEDFLLSLISFDRLVTIDMLSISNQSGKSEKGQTLSFSLRGKAYFKK